MEKGPQDGFDAIRKHLQMILLRAELPSSPSACEACAFTVGQIVAEIRVLEAYVHELILRLNETEQRNS